jgi:hypothetical protein
MSVAPEEQVPVQEQPLPTEVEVEAGTESQVVEEEAKGEEQKTITSKSAVHSQSAVTEI